MRLLIIGATGGTGRELVRQALEQGHEVTALARDPARFTIAHTRMRVLKGDVLDPPSLRAAMRGQDAVVSALGHKRWLGPTRILSEGTRNIITAMEAASVRRFVCQTSLGVSTSWGRLGLLYTLFVVPIILPFYYWDKGRQERIVTASALDWTIVQPGILTNGPARGAFRHGHGIGQWILSVRISRADTAAFMLDEVAARRYVRQVVEVAY
jgi:putative NADH-flavin reductase